MIRVTGKMTMLKRFKTVMRDETGAVTVDWVVLTALIIALGAPVGISIQSMLTSASETVSVGIAEKSSLLP